MNNKQLNTMWLGIVIIVLFSLFVLNKAGPSKDVPGTVYSLLVFLVVVTIVAVITGGLIASFADKKESQPKNGEKQ